MNIIVLKKSVDNYFGVDIGKDSSRKRNVEHLFLKDKPNFLNYMMNHSFELFPDSRDLNSEDIVVRTYLGEDAGCLSLDAFVDSDLKKNIDFYSKHMIKSVENVTAKKLGFFEKIYVGFDENVLALNDLPHILNCYSVDSKKKEDVFLRRLFHVSFDSKHVALYQVNDTSFFNDDAYRGGAPVAYAVERKKNKNIRLSNVARKPVLISPVFYLRAIDTNESSVNLVGGDHFNNYFEDPVRVDYSNKFLNPVGLGVVSLSQPSRQSTIELIRNFIREEKNIRSRRYGF
ncbi:hypothetical protein K9L97_02365 [Candidatus Woesearchaeota archaeon]|nr:hypothetical protein [Candidatus Woesearchaeota archaeon]